MGLIGLCDCNNFFVSCERLFRPELEGRAVVVLSNNDGCAIARSNEAKALGVKMGQPLFQIQDFVRRGELIICSSNYRLYGDLSSRVMTTLKEHLPSIEIYSIDEAFLDYSGFPIDGVEGHGREIARIVRRNTGIPVSIGIAPTKTLAKIASKLCKQYPKLKGCCLMRRAEDIEKVLRGYPVADVWGIGRRSAKMLLGYGVTTAWEFRSAPESWVRGMMGLTGLRTWRELNGEQSISFEDRVVGRQSITVSRSFSHEIYDFNELHQAVITFAARAGEKLRAQGSVSSQLQVVIFTNRHREDRPQHHEGMLHQFTTPTDSTLEIASAAAMLLKKLYREGFGYKKAGVSMMDISSKQGVQSSFFDGVDHERHTSLMETMDRVNKKMGRETIRLGSQGDALVPSSSDYRSPNYTTEWSDILTIKV
ncbi:MAG: Y-family DNA polymerase [Rikenellaceae bacterium]